MATKTQFTYQNETSQAFFDGYVSGHKPVEKLLRQVHATAEAKEKSEFELLDYLIEFYGKVVDANGGIEPYGIRSCLQEAAMMRSNSAFTTIARIHEKFDKHTYALWRQWRQDWLNRTGVKKPSLTMLSELTRLPADEIQPTMRHAMNEWLSAPKVRKLVERRIHPENMPRRNASVRPELAMSQCASLRYTLQSIIESEIDLDDVAKAYLREEIQEITRFAKSLY